MSELTSEQRVLLSDVASGKHEQRAAFRVRMRDGRPMPGDGAHLLEADDARVTKLCLEQQLLFWKPGQDGASARLCVTDAGVAALASKPKPVPTGPTSDSAREALRSALTEAIRDSATIGDGELLRVASSALTELVSLKGPE